MKRALTLMVSLVMVACARPEPPAPPTPAPAPPPAKRYGPIMVAVAHHDEMLGRAIAAERWELAAFALRELTEDLEELPSAEQPEESRANLSEIARPFGRANLPAIERAVSARDVVAARAAYGALSTACNACHATGGFAFIVVPTVAGESVPVIARESADASADVVIDASEDASREVVRRLPGAGGSCDDRVGCARGLVCCTHGGTAMPRTHYGICMTFHGCNTQPAAMPMR